MQRTIAPSSGHTLIELLVVCAIVGILGALALPEAEAFVRTARQRARVTAFVVSIQLARGEALRRGHPVTLCPSDDGESCGKDLSAGWIVFDDRKGDRDRGPGDDLIDRYEAPRAGAVKATIKVYTWRTMGRRATNGTVTFCDGGDGSRSRAVVISPTGRPRVADRLPGDKKLPC